MISKKNKKPFSRFRRRLYTNKKASNELDNLKNKCPIHFTPLMEVAANTAYRKEVYGHFISISNILYSEVSRLNKIHSFVPTTSISLLPKFFINLRNKPEQSFIPYIKKFHKILKNTEFKLEFAEAFFVSPSKIKDFELILDFLDKNKLDAMTFSFLIKGLNSTDGFFTKLQLLKKYNLASIYYINQLSDKHKHIKQIEKLAPFIIKQPKLLLLSCILFTHEFHTIGIKKFFLKFNKRFLKPEVIDFLLKVKDKKSFISIFLFIQGALKLPKADVSTILNVSNTALEVGSDFRLLPGIFSYAYENMSRNLKSDEFIKNLCLFASKNKEELPTSTAYFLYKTAKKPINTSLFPKFIEKLKNIDINDFRTDFLYLFKNPAFTNQFNLNMKLVLKALSTKYPRTSLVFLSSFFSLSTKPKSKNLLLNFLSKDSNFFHEKVILAYTLVFNRNSSNFSLSKDHITAFSNFFKNLKKHKTKSLFKDEEEVYVAIKQLFEKPEIINYLNNPEFLHFFESIPKSNASVSNSLFSISKLISSYNKKLSLDFFANNIKFSPSFVELILYMMKHKDYSYRSLISNPFDEGIFKQLIYLSSFLTYKK